LLKFIVLRTILCKEFSKEIPKHQIHPDDGKRHRHRSFAMSEAEIKTFKNPL
jgi:hypothetical protein